MLLTSHIVIMNLKNAFGIKKKKKKKNFYCIENILIYELNICDYINWIYELKIY